MSDFKHIISNIENASGDIISQHSISPIGGGCINSAYKLDTDNKTYFIKSNQANLLPMFEAEAEGLAEFKQLDCVTVPVVVCYGSTASQSYLVLEYIELKNLRRNSGQLLGTQLAQLHRQIRPYFGWHRNNTIGSTPQYNKREHDWPIFWKQQRLEPQLNFAKKNGFGAQLQDKGQLLLECLHLFFDSYTPEPVLLHGDLWGGNAAADSDGNPVLFDPATYYGDRETDIAMTELFGGFDSSFYDAYQSAYPLDYGYKTRKILYNLYHILNHVNLFGGGYLSQAESMLDQLLSET